MAIKQQPDTHKPTFRATPKRRAWHRRLTPAAWLLIGVGGALATLLIVAVLGKLLGGQDTPFVLPPTVTPVVRLTSGEDIPPSTATPTPEPGSWWTEPSTTTLPSEATLDWAAQMACDAQGTCLPPAQIADEIVAAYWEWKEAIPFYYYELDMTPEELERHYMGEILDLQLEFVALVAETGAMWEGATLVTEYEYETRLPHVASCSPDGQTCLVGETVQGDLTLYKYDLASRQVVETIANPQDRQYHGANVWRFQYDQEDSKWKVERYVEWVPAPVP